MAGLTIGDPVTLTQAFSSGNIIPGDILRLRSGTYRGDWIANIGGTEAAPVKIMPYNGEAVKIDGTWTFGKPYLEVYDVEMMNSGTDRHEDDGVGVTMNYPGCWLVGCDIHDLHSSGVNWFGHGAGGVVECLLRNNGMRYPDNVGHGHAIYTHNNIGGSKLIARNLFCDQIGDYTIHVYSGGNNYLKDYTIEDNIICGDNVHTGGGFGLVDMVYRNNVQYKDYSSQGRYTKAGYTNSGTISGNIYIGLDTFLIGDQWSSLTEENNLVYGGEPADRAGYTQTEIPATLVKLVAFSKSIRWKGSVTIFNRDSAETVAVDFSSILSNGDYLLRNGQNPAETWAFTYAGSAINVPMDTTTWTTAARIGETTPPTTFPVFGAFVIEAA